MTYPCWFWSSNQKQYGIYTEIIFIWINLKKNFHQGTCSYTEVINQHLLEVTWTSRASKAAGVWFHCVMAHALPVRQHPLSWRCVCVCERQVAIYPRWLWHTCRTRWGLLHLFSCNHALRMQKGKSHIQPISWPGSVVFVIIWPLISCTNYCSGSSWNSSSAQ